MAAPTPAFRHRTALIVSAVTALAFPLGTASEAGAAPRPDESALRAELTRLNRKVDQLIKDYAARRESLREAERAERAARTELDEAEREYAEAAAQVASIVRLRYQSGTDDLPSMLFGPAVSGAVVMEQLTAEQTAQTQAFARSRDLQKQASDRATQLTARIEREAEGVEDRRREAEKVIRDIEERLDRLVPAGSGRRADGSWAPQLPGGQENITDRTRIMLDAVKSRFDLPYQVGCYRSGGGGEHPLGRACDFMMSTGGTTPSPENTRLGDAIAAWAVKNKDRLGVKYVIWRQRINMGSGWRAMSDRGGVTANHYDHPHISMY
ncbi:hypothetical protein GCM10017673_11800 [Streptosporangium violaceochromogenes]|nr:hypothetical protein GCM10017673_11800 [Streptosporangium violaceochromogenes]